MKLTYSDQFKSPCVVIEAGDAYDECMRYITDNNAVWFDGEEDCCVVDFSVGRGVGPELYTKEALRRSFAQLGDRGVLVPPSYYTETDSELYRDLRVHLSKVKANFVMDTLRKHGLLTSERLKPLNVQSTNQS